MDNIHIICVSENKKRLLCLNKQSKYCIVDENFNILLDTDIIGKNCFLGCISKNGDRFSVFDTEKAQLSVYDANNSNQICSFKISDLYSYIFLNEYSLFIIEQTDECVYYSLNIFCISNKSKAKIYMLKKVDLCDFGFHNNELFLVFRSIEDNEFKLLRTNDFGNSISIYSLNDLIKKNAYPISFRLSDDCSKILYIHRKYFNKSDIILVDIENRISKKMLSVPFKKIQSMNLALNINYLSEQYFTISYDNELFVYDMFNMKIVLTWHFDITDFIDVIMIYDDILLLEYNDKIIKLKLT